MTNSTESTSFGAFSCSRLVQLFPRHDTVQLDVGNFVQWQQHVRLIIEGYELQGFLDGTLPVLAHFMTSPDGNLTPNPEASVFIQQDKFLASWLLYTISMLLLSYFIFAKTACEIWSTANRLFAAATGAKLSRIKHDLHSIKKCTLIVKEYIAKIQNTCALLEASGSVVSEAEKVEVIFVTLSSNFDAVLTLASFSSDTLLF
ncbi:hypothetical protein J1N35_035931 [Gossypium stocksii]|uniref:Retrotransposon Copia-like N-terminal domain-containing protein n=1 Tax=Gossypium stocksii TaxID=47602 RepID=A0A9D3UV35_9ROSI|nr:hypothetical protein J1N35_035931 [Gossypium stocksii]